MAEKNPTASVAAEHVATPQSQPPQARPCPKDCRKCSWTQQICCSAMMSFQMFEVMNSVITRIDLQSQRIYELEQRLTAIQSAEAELAAPAPIQGGFAEE